MLDVARTRGGDGSPRAGARIAWLGAHLGAAAVEGFQGGADGGDLTDPESLAACAKHFVAYGLARAGGTTPRSTSAR